MLEYICSTCFILVGQTYQFSDGAQEIGAGDEVGPVRGATGSAEVVVMVIRLKRQWVK